MFCVCQRYTNGGRRGSFFSETGEKKELNYFFFEKNADSSLREEKKNIVPHS